MSDAQKQVQEAIDQLVESGAERGLQVAVYRRGELVVDAVAGAASGIAIALTKNRVTYGQFNAFNQVGEIIMKTLSDI